MNPLFRNIKEQLIENLTETYQRKTVEENILMFLDASSEEQFEFIDAIICDFNFLNDYPIKLTKVEIEDITRELVAELSI